MAESHSSWPKDQRLRDEADGWDVPLSGSVYVVWALTLIAAMAALVTALALSTDSSYLAKGLYSAGLFALIPSAFALAYRFESRRRFITVCRSNALDLAFAIATRSPQVVAESIDEEPLSLSKGEDSAAHGFDRALDEVRKLERALLDAGAYRDAAAVSDARRHAEASRANRPENQR